MADAYFMKIFKLVSKLTAALQSLPHYSNGLKLSIALFVACFFAEKKFQKRRFFLAKSNFIV